MRQFVGLAIACFAFFGCVSRPVANLALPLAQRQELSSKMNESQKKIVETCPYFNFVVDDEQTFDEVERLNPGWQSAERDRKIWLDATRQAVSALGFTQVSDVKQAGFILNANGGKQNPGQLLFVSVGIGPTPRLVHHAFVASMNDEAFPFSINLAASYTFTFPAQGYATDYISKGVTIVTDIAWSQSHRTVLALCEVSELLVTEGITMEELRQELVKEIQHIRQQRIRARQMKQLEIEVESSGERSPMPGR
jgi:hypothetical protein